MAFFKLEARIENISRDVKYQPLKKWTKINPLSVKLGITKFECCAANNNDSHVKYLLAVL